MKSESENERLVADLRDQVEALEEIVRRRSDELRLIQRLVCPKDRIMIESILDGNTIRETQLATIDQYYAMNWHSETTHFTPSSVEEALEEVWQTAPRRLAPNGFGS